MVDLYDLAVYSVRSGTVSEQALISLMRAASHIYIDSLVYIDYIYVLNKLPSALTSSQS